MRNYEKKHINANKEATFFFFRAKIRYKFVETIIHFIHLNIQCTS